VVDTIWERFSRARSSTRSMATPRRRQDRTGTSSMMSGSAGHAVASLAGVCHRLPGKAFR
jgi:hypothetical protein